jgi:probable HAF family extracellular repeat protein
MALVLALNPVLAPAAHAQQYTVTGLGFLPQGSYSAATAINNAGQVVGNSTGGVGGAFLYTASGGMQDLGSLGGLTAIGSSNGRALAINNSGQVVGWSWINSNTPDIAHAYLYTAGSGMQDLGAPVVLSGQLPSSYGCGVNDAGEVVGCAYVTISLNTVPPSTTEAQQAFLSTASGGMQNLGAFSGGLQSFAEAINNAGEVVGYSNSGTVPELAFLYTTSGGMKSLGAPSGGESFAYGVNDVGQIVGDAIPGSGDYNPHAVLWNSAGSMQYLDSGGFWNEANAINNVGQVVGEAEDGIGSGYGSGYYAVLYSGGNMVNLNTLIAPGSDWTLQDATGINDLGRICGYGIDPSGNTEAFLLTPTPEPTSLVILAFGGLGLLLRRRAC